MVVHERKVGKYTILFYKSPISDEYRIVVYDDEDWRAIEVKAEKLEYDYVLTIRREKLGEEKRIDITILEGMKEKKNFETMKKLIDKFFPQ